MLLNGERGIVQSINETHLTIALSSSDSCDTCGLKVVCAPGKTNSRTLILPNPGNTTIGQEVQIEEISNLELHLALVQFGLPMLAFLIGLGGGILIPQSFMPKELMAFIFGLATLGSSFFIARNFINHITENITENYLKIRTSISLG